MVEAKGGHGRLNSAYLLDMVCCLAKVLGAGKSTPIMLRLGGSCVEIQGNRVHVIPSRKSSLPLKPERPYRNRHRWVRINVLRCSR